jgi:hypothetical protein
MRVLKPKGFDVSGDQIILEFEDETGELCQAAVGTMDAGTMISALAKLIEEISLKPTDRNPMMPGMNFVQLLETAEEVWLRISIGDHGLFHDYPVPKNTTLAEDLRLLADRVAARQEAKVTHPQSGNPGRRH